mmetsp:Transcript_55445/g.154500  ORF Transcript_55445/g.154500 Transcript_55445/m.154500 type:complete len:202 (-) Transcript_55445:1383-1988(-)
MLWKLSAVAISTFTFLIFVLVTMTIVSLPLSLALPFTIALSVEGSALAAPPSSASPRLCISSFGLLSVSTLSFGASLALLALPTPTGFGADSVTFTTTTSSKMAVPLDARTMPLESNSNFNETRGIPKWAYLPDAASWTPEKSMWTTGVAFSRIVARTSKPTLTFTVFFARSFDPAVKRSTLCSQPFSWSCEAFKGLSTKL